MCVYSIKGIGINVITRLRNCFNILSIMVF